MKIENMTKVKYVIRKLTQMKLKFIVKINIDEI